MINYNKELYDKNILFKACYKFIDKCYVHLDLDENNFIVSITSKDDSDKCDYEKMFSNEIIEQKNRDIIFNETKNIREMLYARALASSVIYSDEISKNDEKYEENDAMKDWFDNE